MILILFELWYMLVLEGITAKGSNPKSSTASNKVIGDRRKYYEDV